MPKAKPPLTRPNKTPNRRSLTRIAIGGAVVAALSISTMGAAAMTTDVTASAADSQATVLPFASSGWSYYRGAADPGSSWTGGSTSWTTGTAPFGFGLNTGQLGTQLQQGSPAPLASYFSHGFSLAAVPASGLTLQTWADDGVVVYVNGVEAVRRNMPTGAIGPGTYATAAPQSSTARANLITVQVPASSLRVGANVIAAEVHSNWRATHNSSFDAALAYTVPSEADAPATPNPPAPGTGTESGEVAGWGAPSWRDEFTYKNSSGQPAIDPTKWNVRDRSDLGLLQDAAEPESSQVSVDSAGIAHLTGDWLDQPFSRPAGQAGVPTITHKTGYMDQRKLQSDDMSYSQQYGRWEIRAKTPTGPKTFGSLAAFWLRNSQSGEIDIMEAWGYNEQAAPGGQRIDTATTTVHTQTSGSGNQKYYWTHADFGAATPVWDDFHTYAFEFTPTYAAIIVDGKQLTRVTPATHPNLWNPSFFGSPLHVRLNLHVGPSATYWGLPDPNNKSWTQPLDYQVDYVRIWKYQG